MLIIGLTGKTGAGKSTVAALLRKRGCFIVDGDVLARELVSPGSPALRELAAVFGEDIILADGSLDRKKLASRAFSSKEKTELLNSITHPRIKKRAEELISQAQTQGFTVAVIDAAALLEGDCRQLCEKIVVVHAEESIRLERILRRDKITPEQALSRMRAQREDSFYLSQADAVILNNTEGVCQTELLKLEELIS